MPGFDEESADRIARVVRQVEAYPVNELPASRGPRVMLASMIAMTTSSITAANSTTKALGMGTAQLQLVTRDSSNNATWAASTQDPVTIYNPNAATIASGRRIRVGIVDGVYMVQDDYCNQ